MNKEKKAKNLTPPLLVGLLVLAAFLLGSLWTKNRYLEEKETRNEGTAAGQQASPTVQPTQPPFSPQKTAKPEVKFFVMSFCPYGTQAEEGLAPVYELLGDQVTWQPQYVIYQDYCAQAPTNQKAECETSFCLKKNNQTFCSMHGLAELNQDLREVCVFQMGNLAAWWQFNSGVNSNCSLEDIEECWQAEAQKAGLGVTQIENCLQNQKYSLVQKEVEVMTKYQVRGSPTVFINDVLYNGGRAPEDYKKAICASFENPPEECQTVLGEESAGAAGGC